jgi:hypothetical protein
MLRRTSGSKLKEVVTREWIILLNEDLHNLYFAKFKIRSRDSSVGTAAGYGLDEELG